MAMSQVRLLLVTIFIFQGLLALAEAYTKVKQLHVLFRHGEKVPHKEYQSYPNDPHQNHSYFPMDSGDLTNIGKLHEYKIGRMLRDRYGNFFGPYYSPSSISARSTSVPRTQMSLQLVLAGLFPPSEQQIWNPHLPWLPVSTFSVPEAQDNLLFPDNCPQYIKLYKTFLEQPATKKTIAKYSNVMNYITQHSGKLVETTEDVIFLYNLFIEQQAQNLTLPEWTHKIYPTPMKKIAALDFNLRSYTNQLKRFNGGVLLREIIGNIEALRDGILVPTNRKAFFYSAHEFNVAALTRTLGLKKPVLPNYASTIIIETLQDEIEHYYVRIILWRGVNEQLDIQSLPGCNKLCPLEKFVEILSDVIPTAQEVDQCHHELMHAHDLDNGKTSME